MNMSQREQFEKWAVEVRVSIDLRRTADGFSYQDLDTDWLWSTYCAGWADAKDTK
jgi:hypothetical protein